MKVGDKVWVLEDDENPRQRATIISGPKNGIYTVEIFEEDREYDDPNGLAEVTSEQLEPLED